MWQRATTGASGGGSSVTQSSVSGDSYPTGGSFTGFGFKPKKLYITMRYIEGQGGIINCMYDEDKSNSTYVRTWWSGGTYGKNTTESIADSSSAIGIKSIDADGFSFTSQTTASRVSEIYFLAVG